MSIFQDGGRRVGNILQGSGLMTALIYGGGSLFAYQITVRYLDPRLR